MSMEHQPGAGVLGTIISIFFATLSFLSMGTVQPIISAVAGVVAIIAGITTIYKNIKK